VDPRPVALRRSPDAAEPLGLLDVLGVLDEQLRQLRRLGHGEQAERFGGVR